MRDLILLDFQLEDKCDSLNKEVKSLNSMLVDAEDEKKRLLLEANQVGYQPYV